MKKQLPILFLLFFFSLFTQQKSIDEESLLETIISDENLDYILNLSGIESEKNEATTNKVETDDNENNNNVFNIDNVFYKSSVFTATNESTNENKIFNNEEEKSYHDEKKLENKNEIILPEDLPLHLLQVRDFIKSKLYRLALKKLNALKKSFPENITIRNMEGSVYYKLGFYEFAIVSWKKSLELNPNQTLVEKFVLKLNDLGYE